jgi:predicted ABC-type ATPase
MNPSLTVVAGANGCGKSTLTLWSREYFQQFPVLDPDATAKSLQDQVIAGSSSFKQDDRCFNWRVTSFSCARALR